MTRSQKTQPGGHDAPYVRDAASLPGFNPRFFTLHRMCPSAILSLLGGILTWTAIPIIGAVVAIIFGHLAHRRIRCSDGVLLGGGMATAGMILGYAQIFAILTIIGATRMPPPIG